MAKIKISTLLDYLKFVDEIHKTTFADEKKNPRLSSAESEKLFTGLTIILRGVDKCITLSGGRYPSLSTASTVEQLQLIKKEKDNTDFVALECRKLLSNVEFNYDTVFSSIMYQTEQRLSSNTLYKALYEKFRKSYINGGTMAVGFNPALKSFEFVINKKFITQMPLFYLMSGSPRTMYDSLMVSAPVERIIIPVQFVIMHEIGHILRMHATRKENLYSGFNHKEANLLGDCLINSSLSSKFRLKGTTANITPEAVSTFLQGRILEHIGHVETTRLKQVFLGAGRYTIGQRDVSIDGETTNLIETLTQPEYEALVYIHPVTLMGEGILVETSQIMSFYKKMKETFSMEVKKGRDLSNLPTPPPPSAEKESDDEGESAESDEGQEGTPGESRETEGEGGKGGAPKGEEGGETSKGKPGKGEKETTSLQIGDVVKDKKTGDYGEILNINNESGEATIAELSREDALAKVTTKAGK